MIKVLVIDDQRIAREYMENVVHSGKDYELVGSLSQADLAATVCRRNAVDLVLMDVCTHGTKEAGADSFWHKEVSPEELITVMDATMQGRHIWPGESPTVKLGISNSKELTDAQIKVLRLVCEGLEYTEIAQELHITVRTVKWHVSKILEETGYSNKTQLVIAVTGKRLIIPKLLEDGDDTMPIV